jgi:hypothetical protein
MVALIVVDNTRQLQNGRPARGSPRTNIILAAALAPAPPSFAVSIDGGMPSVQFVGMAVQLSLTVHNVGQAISHFVLRFSGLQSWTLDSITSTWDATPRQIGPGPAYDFGRLSRGEETLVTLNLVPGTPGQRTVSLQSYASIDGNNGVIAPGSRINIGGASRWDAIIKH